jgi:hypothetical protein
MATHGQLVTGVGGTAAESITQIGADITLPAGGPWLIHGLWALIAADTAIQSEAVNGAIRLSSVAGDLTPDPAPGIYPAIGTPSAQSANFNTGNSPLNIWPVRWTAAGKAIVSLSYINDSGNTTGPIVATGILFGDSIPEVKPLVFCDRVAASLTLNTEATIGTITIAEKATRIVGIMATANKDGVTTVDQGMIATVRLDSADIKMPPAQFPTSHAFSAADGTNAGQSSIGQAQFIPLDIPVIGGSRIQCFGTLINAVTAGFDVQVFLAYE